MVERSSASVATRIGVGGSSTGSTAVGIGLGRNPPAVAKIASEPITAR